MYLSIKNNSAFVADSHFNDKNIELSNFLQQVIDKKIEITQLFLMGDIFDFLSCESNFFINKNKVVIDMINDLSKSIEVIFLEGNHDFNIKTLFPDTLVIKREKQPLLLTLEDKKVALSHGDNFTPWHYNLYCKIIRNHQFLIFLNMIDINNFISKRVYNFLIQKNICFKMNDFDSFAQRRLSNYKEDIVIEGHFHQGKSLKTNNRFYLNIPSLCCERKYTIYKNNQFENIKLEG